VFHIYIYDISRLRVKQDKQRSYKVTSRRVRVTIVAVEKEISITYSECVSVAFGIQHAMRMRRILLPSLACPALLCFFPRYLINVTIFEKKWLITKWFVFIFSTPLAWSISRSEKNWARYDRKCVIVFMCSTRYSRQIFMKLEFSWQIFEKYSYTKFNENPSSGNRVITCRRTDRQTDITKLKLAAFRNFANALKIHKAKNKTNLFCVRKTVRARPWPPPSGRFAN